MGYYSDVLIQIETKTNEKLDEVREWFGDNNEADKVRSVPGLKTPTLLLEWNDTKWHEAFEEIQDTMIFLKNLAQDDDVRSVQFVRIGEDLDDMEYKDFGTCPHNFVGVERKFDYGDAEE